MNKIAESYPEFSGCFDTVEKSHGRLETRCIRASTSLNAYLDWPGLAQVFQVRYTPQVPKNR